MKVIILILFLGILFFSKTIITDQSSPMFDSIEQATKYNSATLKSELKIPESHVFVSQEENHWNIVVWQQQCVKNNNGKIKYNLTNKDLCMEFQMVLEHKLPIRKKNNKFSGISDQDLYFIKSKLSYFN